MVMIPCDCPVCTDPNFIPTEPITTTVVDDRPVLTSTTWMAAQLARAQAAATA